MKKVLIIGATSAIAEATARLYAAQGHSLYLLGRNRQRLAAMAADLKVRGAAEVHSQPFDALRLGEHSRLVAGAFKALQQVDIALVAHGVLPEQEACQQDFDAALASFNANAISVLSLLTQLANRLEAQGGGALAVITSVAGDRGRQSNYIYGAAKSMVSTFLQGLRNRLHGAGVEVLDVKPGFVDTPMTAGRPKGLLWASPQQVARGLAAAIAKRKTVAYLPWFWRWIMLAIRLVPEAVFRRLKL